MPQEPDAEQYIAVLKPSGYKVVQSVAGKSFDHECVILRNRDLCCYISKDRGVIDVSWANSKELFPVQTVGLWFIASKLDPVTTTRATGEPANILDTVSPVEYVQANLKRIEEFVRSSQ